MSDREAVLQYELETLRGLVKEKNRRILLLRMGILSLIGEVEIYMKSPRRAAREELTRNMRQIERSIFE